MLPQGKLAMYTVLLLGTCQTRLLRPNMPLGVKNAMYNIYKDHVDAHYYLLSFSTDYENIRVLLGCRYLGESRDGLNVMEHETGQYFKLLSSAWIH